MLVFWGTLWGMFLSGSGMHFFLKFLFGARFGHDKGIWDYPLHVVFVGRFILAISIMISWVTSTCTIDPSMGTQNHEIWRFYTPNIWVIIPKNEGFGFPWLWAPGHWLILASIHHGFSSTTASRTPQVLTIWYYMSVSENSGFSPPKSSMD